MRIAIFGATGYGGAEAMRLLVTRSDVEIAWVGSNAQAGLPVESILPQMRGTKVAALCFSAFAKDEDLPQDVDVALLAMPHGHAQELTPKLLRRGIRVIDFSGDFRLPPAVYEAWYKRRSGSVELPQAVYGLPELYRAEIRTASLIANPGCYATAAELALLPLVEAGWIDVARLMVDAKSGVSGAGKSPQASTHFVEVQESLRAYKVGAHQHTPEIEQTLRDARLRNLSGGGGVDAATMAHGERQPTVFMTTQLLPIRRGIYVTAYAALTQEANAQGVWDLYAKRYRDEPFVDVLPLGQTPEIRYVTGTNVCQLGVHVDARTNTVLAMAALDNLVKGAAGQAIQNLNLMYGLAETEGLTGAAWF